MYEKALNKWVKLNMRPILDEARQMGVTGKHWLNIIKKEIKMGDGYVKVYSIKGDRAQVAGNHAAILGSVFIPVKAINLKSIEELKYSHAVKKVLSKENKYAINMGPLVKEIGNALLHLGYRDTEGYEDIDGWSTIEVHFRDNTRAGLTLDLDITGRKINVFMFYFGKEAKKTFPISVRGRDIARMFDKMMKEDE